VIEKIFGNYAEYYDLLNSDKDYSWETKYHEQIFASFPIKIRSILELGSGTGSHVVNLYEVGYKVLGVDISEDMVRLGKAKLHNAGIDEVDANIIVGDIRSIDLSKTFDLVLSSFHVMSYMVTNQDLTDAFSTARRHLEIGGYFVFDFWFTPGVKNIKATSRTKTLSNNEISVTRTAEPLHIDELNCVDIQYFFKVTNLKDLKTISFDEIHRMRHLEISEVMDLCADDFELVVVFGENTFDRPTQDNWSALAVLRRIK
jgi:SAM-dependent methyltransferase